jgi:hypothetical protein
MLIGHDNREYRTESLGASNAYFKRENSFNNPNFNIGLAKSFENISMGLTYSTPVELKGDNTLQTTHYKNEDASEPFKYPATMAYGVTWKAHEYFRLSSDIDYQFWSDTNDDYVDTIRGGLGVAWTGLSDRYNYFYRIPVRTGVSLANLPVKADYCKIYETAYHLGFSLPLKNTDSYLDFAVKWFWRGDINKHGKAEDGFLISIGTNGFDFLRRPVSRKEPREIPRPDN